MRDTRKSLCQNTDGRGKVTSGLSERRTSTDEVGTEEPEYEISFLLLFSRIVSTYDALLFQRGRPSVRRPVFVTETWRVIIALVDFAGRDQQPTTARDIYRRRRSTLSLYTMAVRSQCDIFLTV